MFTTTKKITLIVLLIFTLLLILGKNSISEVANVPSIKIHLINIAKVSIPFKNLILMRNVDDKIALLKSSGSCIFCDLTQGNFKGYDLKDIDLRHANLSKANLSNTNLSKANLSNTNLSKANLINANLSKANLINANLSKANLINANLIGVNLGNANLSKANLIGVDLSNTNLTGANLSGTNLSGVDLSNKDFTGTILLEADLTGANLSGVDFSKKDLTGTILLQADLTGANLSGVDLSNKDLTGVNLSGVDLSNTNLTGVNLSGVDLSNKDFTGANLSGVDLSNKDLTETILLRANLTGANLSGVDLSNKDLTGTILFHANLTGANLNGVDLSKKNLTGTILNYTNLLITRYDLSGDVQYIATKEGFLFESINNESRLVLNLNNDAQSPFSSRIDGGILGVASKNGLVYISYSSEDTNLVVDEYSMNFSKVRNIIKIKGFFDSGHFAGGLVFDNLGKLYLSVGDGSGVIYEDHPQNLNDYRGKILRLDISDLKLEPEIVAYGIRNAWGVTIDSKDRMFILQCGFNSVEAVYLLNDLYSGIPVNFGWPVFEGSVRKKTDPLMFNDVLAPIFEYTKRPGCLTGAVYLDDMESLLIADIYGTIRLLKQNENGEWYLFHEYKQDKSIWGFGLDKKTKKIFIAPNNLELEILVEQVKLNQ